MKKYVAELIGTFAVVFCGTGAVIIDQQTGGQVTHLGVAITFGLIVSVMIYAFGDASGAHLNPAVSFSFWLAGLFSSKQVAPYIAAQILGAFVASGLLKFLFPDNPLLGATLPAGPVMQSFILEGVLSFLLMLVVLFTSQGAKEKGLMAGLAIGGTVLLEALFAGPVSGASMNPARSLAPAILSGHTGALWVYLTAPFIGMGVATFVWRRLK